MFKYSFFVTLRAYTSNNIRDLMKLMFLVRMEKRRHHKKHINSSTSTISFRSQGSGELKRCGCEKWRLHQHNDTTTNGKTRKMEVGSMM